jgi:hypothetical protein
MMNRKGFTLSGVMEGVVIMLLFIFVVNIVVSGMNTQFGKNLGLPTGLSNETSNIYNKLSGQAVSSSNSTLGGDVSQNSFGFSILQAGSLFLAFLSTAWYVLTGGWIPQLLSMATNGWSGAIIIGNILRIFFVIGLVFALIRVVQRIRP